MTVGELREQIKDLPDDAEVRMSTQYTYCNTCLAGSVKFFSSSDELWIYNED